MLKLFRLSNFFSKIGIVRAQILHFGRNFSDDKIFLQFFDSKQGLGGNKNMFFHSLQRRSE